VTFPLGAWIDEHERCRHNLAVSGMRGSIPPPRIPRAPGDPEELRAELARSVGVDPGRIFLTHGATEGNSCVTAFVRGRSTGRAPVCRVRYPEYPPLFEMARQLGFRLDSGHRRAALAVVSRPRNPEGDLWSSGRLFEWAEGAEQLLVDETFREFGRAPSIAARPRSGLWSTGTFTKFYAGDDLRVGFVVAPEEEAARFARFHGVVADEIAPVSVGAALACLRRRPQIAAAVDRIVDANRREVERAFPGSPAPVGPVHFDRNLPLDSGRLSRRCLAASVLVCPGGFFGDPGGVRLCLTRPTFARDLAAYLAVRDAARRASRVSRAAAPTGARPRRAGSGRTGGGRG
jgi:aspartate/methionine/tyrosine aminotransferase